MITSYNQFVSFSLGVAEARLVFEDGPEAPAGGEAPAGAPKADVADKKEVSDAKMQELKEAYTSEVADLNEEIGDGSRITLTKREFIKGKNELNKEYANFRAKIDQNNQVTDEEVTKFIEEVENVDTDILVSAEKHEAVYNEMHNGVTVVDNGRNTLVDVYDGFLNGSSSVSVKYKKAFQAMYKERVEYVDTLVWDLREVKRFNLLEAITVKDFEQTAEDIEAGIAGASAEMEMLTAEFDRHNADQGQIDATIYFLEKYSTDAGAVIPDLLDKEIPALIQEVPNLTSEQIKARLTKIERKGLEIAIATEAKIEVGQVRAVLNYNLGEYDQEFPEDLKAAYIKMVKAINASENLKDKVKINVEGVADAVPVLAETQRDAQWIKGMQGIATWSKSKDIEGDDKFSAMRDQFIAVVGSDDAELESKFAEFAKANSDQLFGNQGLFNFLYAVGRLKNSAEKLTAANGDIEFTGYEISLSDKVGRAHRRSGLVLVYEGGEIQAEETEDLSQLAEVEIINVQELIKGLPKFKSLKLNNGKVVEDARGEDTITFNVIGDDGEVVSNQTLSVESYNDGTVGYELMGVNRFFASADAAKAGYQSFVKSVFANHLNEVADYVEKDGEEAPEEGEEAENEIILPKWLNTDAQRKKLETFGTLSMDEGQAWLTFNGQNGNPIPVSWITDLGDAELSFSDPMSNEYVYNKGTEELAEKWLGFPEHLADHKESLSEFGKLYKENDVWYLDFKDSQDNTYKVNLTNATLEGDFLSYQNGEGNTVKINKSNKEVEITAPNVAINWPEGMADGVRKVLDKHWDVYNVGQTAVIEVDISSTVSKTIPLASVTNADESSVWFTEKGKNYLFNKDNREVVEEVEVPTLKEYQEKLSKMVFPVTIKLNDRVELKLLLNEGGVVTYDYFIDGKRLTADFTKDGDNRIARIYVANHSDDKPAIWVQAMSDAPLGRELNSLDELTVEMVKEYVKGVATDAITDNLLSEFDAAQAASGPDAGGGEDADADVGDLGVDDDAGADVAEDADVAEPDVPEEGGEDEEDVDAIKDANADFFNYKPKQMHIEFGSDNRTSTISLAKVPDDEQKPVDDNGNVHVAFRLVGDHAMNQAIGGYSIERVLVSMSDSEIYVSLINNEGRAFPQKIDRSGYDYADDKAAFLQDKISGFLQAVAKGTVSPTF